MREAVEAFPELYFARLVILGEGDSEQVVLPRMLEAAGVLLDLRCVSVVPLGGRHVNHFWRLLSSLDIPYLTLLDLDTARHRRRMGKGPLCRRPAPEAPCRSRSLKSGMDQSRVSAIPAWDDPDQPDPLL